MKAERSLKARALQLLAQRDQSRLELRRKLLRQARGRDVPSAVAGDVEPHAVAELDSGAIASEIEALLDWLEANRYLCDARFAESRVHARAQRFGAHRIRSELAQHGVELPSELAAALASTELDRAAAVRARRFSSVPGSAAERAAQSRFLLARGFAPELVQRLMRRLGRVEVVPAEGASDAD